MDHSSRDNSPCADKVKEEEVPAQEYEEVINHMICHRDILRANIVRFSIRPVEVLREDLVYTSFVAPSKLKVFLFSLLLRQPYVACPALANEHSYLQKREWLRSTSAF